MELENLLKAAKHALEFIASIDGYANGKTANELRQSIEAVEHTLAPDGLPAGHHGSSLTCTHPFCVAEREQAAAGKA